MTHRQTMLDDASMRLSASCHPLDGTTANSFRDTECYTIYAPATKTQLEPTDPEPFSANSTFPFCLISSTTEQFALVWATAGKESMLGGRKLSGSCPRNELPHMAEIVMLALKANDTNLPTRRNSTPPTSTVSTWDTESYPAILYSAKACIFVPPLLYVSTAFHVRVEAWDGSSMFTTPTQPTVTALSQHTNS